MRVKVKSQLGLLLIIISCLLWAIVLAVPLFTRSDLAQKATLTASLPIVSEVSFGLGILLTGKQLALRYRRKLNPYYWWQRITNSK
ncbi:transporter suffix domain-containing protein [Chamaesiphon minutus]|uniref:Uncharacterized protein n=1 Tax=Chamaesiphon minutus (strain ATCC 27169 / PCC 6605) TaxID=1173020 RepID=K9UIF4_CHAP6|nr:transporter suffix domain-containing protein [Chamaesiphon minutus]AFY94226.1 hypothetical protein Cha6605_3216 [Chamaesiphon minutus PCC 6605]